MPQREWVFDSIWEVHQIYPATSVSNLQNERSAYVAFIHCKNSYDIPMSQYSPQNVSS